MAPGFGAHSPGRTEVLSAEVGKPLGEAGDVQIRSFVTCITHHAETLSRWSDTQI